jgi:hypothetical protein
VAGAEIDLAVGWNAPLAACLPTVSRARHGRAVAGTRGHGPVVACVVRAARGWRAHRYDLVVNFEPDIRSTCWRG